jgi:hypothetical protein
LATLALQALTSIQQNSQIDMLVRHGTTLLALQQEQDEFRHTVEIQLSEWVRLIDRHALERHVLNVSSSEVWIEIDPNAVYNRMNPVPSVLKTGRQPKGEADTLMVQTRPRL